VREVIAFGVLREGAGEALGGSCWAYHSRPSGGEASCSHPGSEGLGEYCGGGVF
jgi:hypothetical protein